MSRPKGQLTGPMQRAAKLAAEGYSTQQIADELGVNRSTVARWFHRDDMKNIRSAALSEVVGMMVPRAYAVLQAQLDHPNPWVAQGAARELIRLHTQMQGAEDANVVVMFGNMKQPGAPGSAGELESAPQNEEIETDFSE